MHLWLPMLLASVLAGAGTYGVLARRNAVLVLIGVELILNAANVMLVTAAAPGTARRSQTGRSLTLFVITIAAAEICVALAVVLAMFQLAAATSTSPRAPDLRRRPARRGGEPATVVSWDVQLLVVLPALAAPAGLLLRRRAPLRAGRGPAPRRAPSLSVFHSSETAGRSEVIDTSVRCRWASSDPPEPPRRPHLGARRRRRRHRRAGRPGVLGLVPARRPALRRFAATVSLFARRHAARRPVQRPRAHARRLGGHGLVLLPADRPRQRAAGGATGGYKAFLVTRVADIGFVSGGDPAVGAGSTDRHRHCALDRGSRRRPRSSRRRCLTAALVLLLAGVAGKSGLIPFHDWLPDAMEGPTPASALIHAATMVAAGTYVVARLLPLYAVDDTARIAPRACSPR